MDKDLINMIEADKELEYILKEVLFAKQKNVNSDFSFQIRSQKVKNRRVSVISLMNIDK